MKNKIVIIGIILSTFVNAQTSGKALLDKVTKKMKSYTSMYSTFDYELNNQKENIHDKQQGYIYIKGDQYHLNLLGIQQIYDGKKIYTISEEDEEVTVSSANNEGTLLTPNKVLSSYKKGFNVTLGDNKKYQQIILTPEKKSNTKNVVIYVNPKTYDLYSITEENHEGTRTTLTLTNFIPNFPVPLLLLQYDKNKYQDYLITELDE